MLFFSQLINGLQLGSIYALVALGYSMVYGIISLLNFAHGDIIMVGGYIALMSLSARLPAPAAIALTIAGCVVLAVVIEKIAYKPLRGAPRISLLITAIGISLLLQNGAQLLFSANAKPFPSTSILPGTSLHIGSLNLSIVTIVTIAVSLVSMLILTLLVGHTRLGKAMRAVSEDADAASLMGINVNSIVSFTFAVGSALAGVGSVLFCCRYPLVSPSMGAMLGLKAFIAAVLGGIGSIPGAMVGGFAIGLCEILVTAVGLSTWSDGVVFAILIVVLLARPTGLMGRSVAEKV